MQRRNSILKVFVGGLVTLVALAVTSPAQALTPLERDLKKVERYLTDGFCEDALKLATELSKSKEGAENFDVWFAMVRGQYCLHNVSQTLAIVDQLRQVLTLNPTQEGALTNFVRTKIEDNFGEIRLSLPSEKSGQIDLVINRVGALKDPELEPFFENVRKRAASGIELPAKIYVPFGTYEIDEVERTVEDYRGIAYIVGKERLSRWKRSQIGDGQAFGIGFMNLQGFTSDPYDVLQPTGTQTLVPSERLSVNNTLYFELSSTHSTRLGTLGMVGVRGDVRARPPAEFLGGVVKNSDDQLLVPAYYGGGLSINLDIPGPKDIHFQGGLGARFSYLSYVHYLAFVTDPLQGVNDPVRTRVDMPAYGFGPELTLGAGKAFRAGSGGVQVGLELQAGVIVLSALEKEGEIDVQGYTDPMDFVLTDEGALWGFNLGTMLYLRTPFF